MSKVAAKTLGIIASQGELPAAVAAEARRQGYRTIVAGMQGLASDSVAEHADAIKWVKPGKLGAVIKFLKQNDVTELVSVGKFPKSMLLRAALNPDLRLIKLLFNLANRSDDSVLDAVVKELRREGIELRDTKDFCRSQLMPTGVLTPTPPSAEEWRDVAFGFKVAKQIGSLEIGQTVVVKGLAVVAVEAAEGTDDTIRRAGEFAGSGSVVVKVSRPGQDMRVDVPVVGMDTLTVLKSSGARVLALEAGTSILLRQQEFLDEAEDAGISVVGVTQDSLAEY